MSRALKIKDLEGLYFVTFTVVHWCTEPRVWEASDVRRNLPTFQSEADADGWELKKGGLKHLPI